MRSSSTPFSASASTSRTPLRSTRPRTLSGTRLPLAPDDPSRLREKRAPSSSAKSTTASVTGGVVPLIAAQRLDAGEDAERTVQPAAVGHRVEMAADDDGLRPRAGQRDPVVAGGVGFGAQPLGGQQVVEPAAGVAPYRTPRDTLGAVGVAGPRRQGAEMADDLACAHWDLLARCRPRPAMVPWCTTLLAVDTAPARIIIVIRFRHDLCSRGRRRCRPQARIPGETRP